MTTYPRLSPEERAVLARHAGRRDEDARLGTSRREMARFRRHMEREEMLALAEWEPVLYAI